LSENTNPIVVIETAQGPITVELFADKAPKTVENFLKYVDDGHYDATIFHRVISKFMIQGGGMDASMREKANGEPVENEADNGLSNERGTLAMARTSDPHSATAQFFINTVDANSFLDHSSKTTRGWGYCVFGKVTDGMDAVDAIRGVATARSGMHDDVPVEPVVISSIKRA
jgi:peptidyl-prolyl cis-trans isomerase B (cyclophilin B)